MTRNYGNSKKGELKRLGLCAKCKVNPRSINKNSTHSYCDQCKKEAGIRYYQQVMITGASRSGKTYESTLLRMAKANAARRNLQFNLTDEQAIAIMHQPCHYCLLPVSMGIDRVDSKLNYDTDTVVPCCGYCNRAKLDKTAKQYEAWLQGAVDRLIAQHLDSGWKAASKTS